MLEGLVAWVINTYVGEYFEDLNADQLSVGLLQGEVELENLPLKKDAFNFSGYPFEICSGCVGKIKLQIPVYRLHSEPWVIFIEKLYIVIGPVKKITYDEKKEKEMLLRKKLSYLQNHEAKSKISNGGKKESNSYGVYSNWKNYSTSLVANIVENIQLNVRDVHIRYEDDISCKNRQFACGLIIRGLAAQSTDGNWVPLFVKTQPNDMTWKLVELEGLSIYWDTNATQMTTNLPQDEMMKTMSKLSEKNILSDGTSKDKEYILSSVDAIARFKRNCSPEVLKSPLNPRMVCDIQLEKIPLYFSQHQYQEIQQWEKSFNCLCVKWSNRKWKPNESISQNPRKWWLYAAYANSELTREETSINNWDALLQRARDLKEYHKVYKEHIKNPENLSVDLMEKKDQLETKLNLDVLVILRELVVEESLRKRPVSSPNGTQEAQAGFLQWMFPSWVGWYSTPAAICASPDESMEVQNIDEKETVLEEELLTVFNTAADEAFQKRDAVLIQLNFCLYRGTFVLIQNSNGRNSPNSKLSLRKPVIELEFSDVFIKFETKPRTRSVLFEIKLGALYLRDRTFLDSQFPNIVAAQNQEMFFTSTHPSGSSFPFSNDKIVSDANTNVSRWLFELVYERNPQDIQSNYRLVVRTKPLDVICNLELIQIVVDIFSSNDVDKNAENIFYLPSAASVHYEHFKEHTKAELQQTWDQMVVGGKKSKKEWCIQLEIAAPQLMIPENIFDANTNVLIIVLGDLHVFNELKLASHISSNSLTYDDEDDFFTPCSSPDEYMEQSLDVAKVSESCKRGELFYKGLYERYTLELQNMQVLVSSLKDSWKFAQMRGSSSLHILDRFSINIQLYRRTFFTQEAQWPSLVFIASLPTLTAHISEVKVGAVKACIEDLEAYFDNREQLDHAITLTDAIVEDKISDVESIACSLEGSNTPSSRSDKSFFLLMQLSVDQMSFDIQSQSQSIAELQVSGVKTRFSNHGCETSVMLTVHSLLVVDALQTYGPDFELLVASHKHVSMDNSSGKIMSTDIVESLPSPVLCQSPVFPDEDSLPWAEEKPDDEALIFVEFKISKAESCQQLNSVNVKFNNLDIIANQETIIELVGLLKRIKMESKPRHKKHHPLRKEKSKSQVKKFLHQATSITEISFNFRLLNILLLRAMKHGYVGHKLATATLRDAHIKANIGVSTEIIGTLGGVQVLDLVTEGTKYQTILSLGKNTSAEDSEVRPPNLSSTPQKSAIEECREALTFHVIKRDVDEDSNLSHLHVFLRMASLYYVHSPHLLFELSSCASEFKAYLKALAISIKSAATEMAKGIVTKNPLAYDGYQDISRSIMNISSDEDLNLHFGCDVYMKSPVIIFPHSSSSPEVFMAHLGHIALCNKLMMNSVAGNSLSLPLFDIKDDKLSVDISGMSLFYVSIESDVSSVLNLEESMSDRLTAVSWSEDTSRCPILYDTVIEITVHPFQAIISSVFGLNQSILWDDELEKMNVDVQVISPLNVDFTKQHYEQMLKLFKNYTVKSGGAEQEHRKLSDTVLLSPHGHPVIESPIRMIPMADSDSTANQHNTILLNSSFILPSMKVELREYMNEKNSLVSVTFQEFNLKYEQKSLQKSTLQATLSSLLMEDLQDHSDTSCRSLLISSKSKERKSALPFISPFQFISSSCPNINKDPSDAFFCSMSPSLPDYLCTENFFAKTNNKIGMKAWHKQQKQSSYPNTPPPSPSSRHINDSVTDSALVSLNVQFITDLDKKAFMPPKTSLFIDVDFNSLDIVFSLHPWNIVFDFFTTGFDLKSSDSFDFTDHATCHPTRQDLMSSDLPNNPAPYEIQLKVSVKRLGVILSKPEYDLASANITSFYSELTKTGSNFQLDGNLGSISVLDLTPMGRLYPERLLTTDDEVMRFSVCSGDKPNAENPELHIQVELSSIMYVHTQRLMTEITTFFQYFYDKRRLISQASVPSNVVQVPVNKDCHSTHTMLNLKAVCPVIVIPANALSTSSLIIKPQSITVTNCIVDKNSFMVNNTRQKDIDLICFEEPQEVKHPVSCQDVISIVFDDVNVFSGSHGGFKKDSNGDADDGFGTFKLLFPSYAVQVEMNLLQEAFTFNLQIERDLCSSHQEASEIKIGGLLSSVYVTLNLDQYKLIRSILSQNFGEALEESIYDPCKEIGQFVLLDTNEEVSTTLVFTISLSNVTLEICDNPKTMMMDTGGLLAKFDFIKSQLSYVVLSNNRKDIDFFSNEIRICDVRYSDCPANKRPNVFTNILLPNKEVAASTLQAELHYRLSNDSTKITILLNNMRVMGIMDFINTTLDYLKCPLDSPNPIQPNTEADSKEDEHTTEIKLNVTNTEFVVVEDASMLDSNAVVAKTTAVIVWKSNNTEKPLSFNLEQFEMFSCILGIEEETALSIIDPVNVCIDLVTKQHSPIATLHEQDDLRTLEISAMNLYMRFSYYDLLMFIKIMESVKRQIGVSTPTYSSPVSRPATNPGKILCDLGFSTSDCEKALRICNGSLDDSALWLTQNAVPVQNLNASNVADESSLDLISLEQKEQKSKSWTLFSIEFRMDSIGLCIIDDCRDADVPILEFHLTDVNVTQKLLNNQEGYGLLNFSLDYYNCSLSGWEPLIEPWKCQLKWTINESFEEQSKKIFLNVTTEDVVNINMTNAFLKLFKMVKDNWTEDYFDRSSTSNGNSGFNKHRSQLMPFALKNQTGCKLWFATQVLTSKRFAIVKDESRELKQIQFENNIIWKPVENFSTSLFTFGKRIKLRHQDSHQETIHQIIIRVDGWQNSLPVSVDHVGVYFRNIVPVELHSRVTDRLIFKVKLGNNAQKCVTIESSLSIVNKLDDVLEVKLESSPQMLYGAREERLFVTASETLPIPLPFVQAQIWVRPVDRGLSFCTHSVQWHGVAKPGEIAGYVRICNSSRITAHPYRFCVYVEHRHYPEYSDSAQFKDAVTNSTAQIIAVPGHRIIILPCLEVHNMLPVDLNFFIPNSSCSRVLKPGKKQAVFDIDIGKQFPFGVSIENFKPSSNVNIFSGARHYPSCLELRDSSNRVLFLQLRVILAAPAAMQLVVSAPFWLVNKTGLPLVFKQDGTHTEAAGQFEEHEMARSMAPFLFSFYDDDASVMCSMRIGKHLHANGVSMWCPRFRLEKGIQVRRLHVAQNNTRPDWVYNIGIEVTSGKGRYKDSNIVTVSPRYHLQNKSRHVLEFCQKFAIHENKNHILSAMPECNFPFHWPRIDLDNLLCVRIASVPNCYWSGGFSIDCIKSFFINMRNYDGVSHFLQSEIVLHGATYYIIFTDAESFPPPIRIDNNSEVSVTYYQTNVSEERLKTTVRPHTSVPYALDEPMLPPYITCSAPGGSVATYNMNIFREGNQLFYENFIYIAFSSTLPSGSDDFRKSDWSNSFVGQELVLDVPSGTRVCLSRKETGKRSQLWRMTSSGMLQHEGSSPPCDLNKLQSPSQNTQKLVLDIAGLGPQPQEFIPLMLRKPDVRRLHTQTWRFTSDGRLCCGYPNMYVQVTNGCANLRAGIFAVLGPMTRFSSVLTSDGIPVEQLICRQKLRGGCGVLSVKVVPDGPTRVLKINDLKEKTSASNSSDSLGECSSPMVKNDKRNAQHRRFELQLNLKLPKGLGLSIISHMNEDLIYMMMHDIMIEFCRTSSFLTIDGSIKNIQIDNQLRETEWPVCLSVTPSSKSDSQRHMPAMHFTLHFTETSLINAKIFKHLIVTMKNLSVYLEEYLVLKLIQFCGFSQSSDELDVVSKSSNELQSSLFHQVANDPRYYFSTLKLALQQVRLSVHTTDQLSPDLQVLKRKLGLFLISFEDAVINLDPFLKVHPFETSHFLIESIVDHYKLELKSQAAKILGAVDFLGNPLGLMNDVSDGLSALIHDGNFGGLIKNVAHGLSDSAAKISESLSDGLGSVAIDERHQLMRKQIRQGFSTSAGNDHLLAGIKGLGIGILGGFTSIFTETYEGAAQEGIQGLLSGLGRGLVGTVAKPTVGLLDFASGAASAVRDTSKRSSRSVQLHRRPPRKNVAHGCLLPMYSVQQALDQELLYKLNDKNYSEIFIAKEVIRSKDDDIQVLVSSERVYFLNVASASSYNIILKVPMCDLLKACYVSSSLSSGSPTGGQRHYIQLHMKDESLSGSRPSSSKNSSRLLPLVESDEWSCKKPQVRCDSGEVAEKAVIQINFAKSLYEERRYTLADDGIDDESEISFSR